MRKKGTSRHAHPGSVREVFAAFGRLGLTSFGGPVAHLGYFQEEFVNRRRWLDEKGYADLVALAQFLPGPASSQVGLALGLSRAGLPGALAAWVGFTLPSAIALILFGYGIVAFGQEVGSGWLRGLKIVAVAVVANAVWGMARTLAPDRRRATLAVTAAVIVLLISSAWSQIIVILAGAVIGRLFLKSPADGAPSAIPVPTGRGTAVACLAVFAILLVLLPVLTAFYPSQALALFDNFYRAGALVFGGGHVILPLLETGVVDPGWVSADDFLAGYGAAQAVPGPLFTFAAFLGTVSDIPPNGVAGGLLCLVAVFLPSFLLIVGVMPFWDALRRRRGAQSALAGVNAAVVGLLLAALYDPVWTSAIASPADFALAATAFLLLALWKVPPWLVVILSAAGGAAIAAL